MVDNNIPDYMRGFDLNEDFGFTPLEDFNPLNLALFIWYFFFAPGLRLPY